MSATPQRPPHFTADSFEAKAHRWIEEGTKHHRIDVDLASSAILYQALAEYTEQHAYKHLFRGAPSSLVPKQFYLRRKVKRARERLLKQIVKTAREMYGKHEVLRRFDHRVLAVHALAASYELPDELLLACDATRG